MAHESRRDPSTHPIRKPPLPTEVGSARGGSAIGQIQQFDAGEWRNFIHEWVQSLLGEYESVECCDGDGSLGRDLVARRSGGSWDHYQCKWYEHPLGPNDVWIELGKFAYYTYHGVYSCPGRYWFVAPYGVAQSLARLLEDPEYFRARFSSNWDVYCRSAVVPGEEIAIEGGLMEHVEQLDFSMFGFVSPSSLVRGHAMTPWFVPRFGDPTLPDISFARRLRALLFGYDYFISYRHDDGLAYAMALELCLRNRGRVVFRDASELPGSAPLWRSISSAIRRSRVFVLVGSDEVYRTQHSIGFVDDEVDYVRKEVACALSKRNPVIACVQCSDRKFPNIDVKETSETADNLRAGTPAETVLDDLVAAGSLWKVRRLVRWSLTTAAAVLLSAVALIVWQQYSSLCVERERRRYVEASSIGYRFDFTVRGLLPREADALVELEAAELPVKLALVDRILSEPVLARRVCRRTSEVCRALFGFASKNESVVIRRVLDRADQVPNQWVRLAVAKMLMICDDAAALGPLLEVLADPIESLSQVDHRGQMLNLVGRWASQASFPDVSEVRWKLAVASAKVPRNQQQVLARIFATLQVGAETDAFAFFAACALDMEHPDRVLAELDPLLRARDFPKVRRVLRKVLGEAKGASAATRIALSLIHATHDPKELRALSTSLASSDLRDLMRVAETAEQKARAMDDLVKIQEGMESAGQVWDSILKRARARKYLSEYELLVVSALPRRVVASIDVEDLLGVIRPWVSYRGGVECEQLFRKIVDRQRSALASQTMGRIRTLMDIWTPDAGSPAVELRNAGESMATKLDDLLASWGRYCGVPPDGLVIDLVKHGLSFAVHKPRRRPQMFTGLRSIAPSASAAAARKCRSLVLSRIAALRQSRDTSFGGLVTGPILSVVSLMPAVADEEAIEALRFAIDVERCGAAQALALSRDVDAVVRLSSKIPASRRHEVRDFVYSMLHRDRVASAAKALTSSARSDAEGEALVLSMLVGAIAGLLGPESEGVVVELSERLLRSARLCAGSKAVEALGVALVALAGSAPTSSAVSDTMRSFASLPWCVEPAAGVIERAVESRR